MHLSDVSWCVVRTTWSGVSTRRGTASPSSWRLWRRRGTCSSAASKRRRNRRRPCKNTSRWAARGRLGLMVYTDIDVHIPCTYIKVFGNALHFNFCWCWWYFCWIFFVFDSLLWFIIINIPVQAFQKSFLTQSLWQSLFAKFNYELISSFM